MSFSSVLTALIPALGGSLTTDLIARYERSPQWRNGEFRNSIPTELNVHLRDVPGLLKAMLARSTQREPSGDLPVVRIDPASLRISPTEPRLTWFGHSAVMLEISGMCVLLDPMLGRVPAPFPFLGRNRYSKSTPIEIEDMPKIDVVVISHDHYDHLDHGSVLKLLPKVKQWIVCLGVARHLIRWGVSPSNIIELDWHEAVQIKDVHFTCTPARHFSGRGFWDRHKSLWSSWVISSPQTRIFFNADSGYGPHFAEIGKTYGPFDLALVECGQYNPKWQAIHMMPEESVQAAIDLRAVVAMPIHWAAFTLALHPWYEPVERFTAEALRLGLQATTPRIGQSITIGDEQPSDRWWENYNV
ncbi:MAG: MBL fold metallo-hydrolase [Ignavibacteria bacterium]|nr:MBL fold metallo-hydrolase [Ignavibacteria bacterium]